MSSDSKTETGWALLMRLFVMTTRYSVQRKGPGSVAVAQTQGYFDLIMMLYFYLDKSPGLNEEGDCLSLKSEGIFWTGLFYGGDNARDNIQ